FRSVGGLALADLAATLERHAPRLRVVALVHHPVADETGLDARTAARLRRDEQRACRATRGVIVTSRWTARRLVLDGLPADRIRVVEPGTDRPERRGGHDDESAGRTDPERRSRPGHTDDAAAASAPHAAGALDARRLLCVATLTARKGHLLLLEALARIAGRPWRLDCVGSAARDPATTAAVRARIAELGLDG